MNTPFHIDHVHGFLQRPHKDCPEPVTGISRVSALSFARTPSREFLDMLKAELCNLNKARETLTHEELLLAHFHLAKIRHLLRHKHSNIIITSLDDLLRAISGKVNLPPVLTYFTAVLNNSHVQRSRKHTTPCTLTENINEVNFIAVHHEIEKHLGRIPWKVLDVIYANPRTVEGPVTDLYNSVTLAMDRAIEALQKLPDKVDPEFFHDNIRNFYEGMDGYNGVSGAQSPSFSLIDIILGIRHSDKFHHNQRKFMYEQHVAYLDFVENNSDFLQIDGVDELRRPCKQRLKNFRKVHMQIVAKYLLRFGTQKGTGGKTMRFLKGTLNDTWHSGGPLPHCSV